MFFFRAGGGDIANGDNIRIQFRGDGSSRFAGTGEFGDVDSRETDRRGVNCNVGGNVGGIIVQGKEGFRSGAFFNAYTGTAEVAGFEYDGRVRLANSTVEINAAGNIKTSGSVSSNYKANGRGTAGINGAASANTIFYLNNSDVALFSVSNTGAITAPNVRFSLEPDNPENYTTTTEEYEEQEEVTPYVPAVPATYDEDGNELTAEVPEVPATYQTVTKTREISNYTGPTLDVKDRLQNLISRLDALEADEIADDATSSNLLTLIASLTARVDARDAVIADLTARIQTLEGGNN